MVEVNRFRDGLLITVIVVIASWFALSFMPVFIAGSNWLSDFRQANFAPEISQNADIVILTITEDTMTMSAIRHAQIPATTSAFRRSNRTRLPVVLPRC